jgi:hypothetical protein
MARNMASAASMAPVMPGCRWSATHAVRSQPSAPINPTTEFADKFRVIAMDQRNAGGQSRAPITAQDGWDSYTAEPLKRGHQDVVPLGRK